MLLAEECLEVGFNRLVQSLSLSVRLWVERREHTGSDAGEL